MKWQAFVIWRNGCLAAGRRSPAQIWRERENTESRKLVAAKEVGEVVKNDGVGNEISMRTRDG